MKFAEGLETLLAPVDSLTPLPGNPRRGDVAAVAESYRRFGQRKPIVVRSMDDGTTVVVAGNHQLQAAVHLGWTEIAVVWADDLSEEDANAFALADNRVGDLGGYDSEALLGLMRSVDSLTGTGYSGDDLLALADAVEVREREAVFEEAELQPFERAYWLVAAPLHEYHRLASALSEMVAEVEGATVVDSQN